MFKIGATVEDKKTGEIGTIGAIINPDGYQVNNSVGCEIAVVGLDRDVFIIREFSGLNVCGKG